MPLTPSADVHRSAPTYGALLLRGLLAGLVAGLLAGGFAFVVGEPSVDAAIAVEEAAAHAAGGDHHGAAPVSRDGQRGGLILATALYGVATGGLLATAYTLLRRRLRTRDDGRAALGLAGAALLGIVLVPFVKYPPAPPGVGDASSIDQRTVSYLSLVVFGLVAAWAAVLAFRAPRPGAPEWRRLVCGLLAFLAVVAVGDLVLPAVDEVPAGFPAGLLWSFRLASLGTQVVLWVTLGLGFAAMVGGRSPARREAAAAA